MTDRIYWPSALTPGVVYAPVVLVAGIPVVLVPVGLHPTSTSWTTPSVDAAWWPGNGVLEQTLPGAVTFDPVKEWLDPGVEWSVSESLDLFGGTTKQSELAFDLLDVLGAVTAEISVRDARTTALLALDVMAGDPFIPCGPGTAAFPATGIASVSRETVIYDAVVAGSLIIGAAPCTRGAYGSRDRAHRVGYTPPVVAAEGARHWQERQCSVWVARFSADGLTMYDPTLIFLGSIGYGIQITARGCRWHVPVAPATEVLGRKCAPLTVELSGFAHYRGSLTSPVKPNVLLLMWAGAPCALTGDDTAGFPSNGGWHATWEDFALAWNAEARRIFVSASISGVNPVTMWISTTGAGDTESCVTAAWNTPVEWNGHSAAALYWRSSCAPPAACLWLMGKVKIPDAVDFAKIPAVYAWAGWGGLAELTLVAKTDACEELHAIITGLDAATQTVTVYPTWPEVPSTTAADSARWAQALITAPTTARLGIRVSASRWDGAVRVAALALDALYGTDLLDSAIDWDHLAQQVRLYSPEPNSVACYLGSEDTLLGFLTDLARVHGFAVTTRYGRLTVVRAGEFAATEASALDPAVADSSLCCSADGKINIPVVVDVSDGLASGILYTIDGVGTLRVVNTTYQEEFGDGKELKIHVPAGAFQRMARGELFRVLNDRAWTVLGPIADPYRTVRVTLPAQFLGLQSGDLVRFSSAFVPSWIGTRGVDCVCQVMEVSRVVFGGAARASVLLRMRSGDPRGYAPEALVAVAGLDAASPIVQLDTASGWGASCFASELATDHVTPRVDAGAAWFSATDCVMLREIDTRTPIADEPFSVVSNDPVTATVTLNGNPSAAMVAKCAVTPYKVVLSLDDYDTVASSLHALFAFIADNSYLLGAADEAPHRWTP